MAKICFQSRKIISKNIDIHICLLFFVVFNGLILLKLIEGDPLNPGVRNGATGSLVEREVSSLLVYLRRRLSTSSFRISAGMHPTRGRVTDWPPSFFLYRDQKDVHR
jgi:hypothetical protein